MKSIIFTVLLLISISSVAQVSEIEVSNEDTNGWPILVKQDTAIKLVAVSRLKPRRKRDELKRLTKPKVVFLKYYSDSEGRRFFTMDGKEIPKNWFVWGYDSIILDDLDVFFDVIMNRPELLEGLLKELNR